MSGVSCGKTAHPEEVRTLSRNRKNVACLMILSPVANWDNPIRLNVMVGYTW